MLTTDRLTLRALAMEDWEPYAAMWADERVTAFIGGEPRSREVAWPKFCQSAGMWTLFDYGMWAVIDRGSNFLGLCGFAQYERGVAELAGFPEAGWAFTADSWGKGVASEAIAGAVAWADAKLSTETRCLIDNGNFASVKVAERNGFSPIADVLDDARVFRRPSPADGAPLRR